MKNFFAIFDFIVNLQSSHMSIVTLIEFKNRNRSSSISDDLGFNSSLKVWYIEENRYLQDILHAGGLHTRFSHEFNGNLIQNEVRLEIGSEIDLKQNMKRNVCFCRGELVVLFSIGMC
ncbi:hypothetical protein ACHQM5_019711 [Ranunculus cassubicifolius]